VVTKLVVIKEIPFKVYSFVIIHSYDSLWVFRVKTNKFRREKDTKTIRLWRCIRKGMQNQM